MGKYRSRSRRKLLRLIDRDGLVCRYCGIELDDPDLIRAEYPVSEWNRMAQRSTYPTIDHIRPTSNGGTDHIDNLCLSCFVCNLRKADEDPTTWSASMNQGERETAVTTKFTEYRDMKVIPFFVANVDEWADVMERHPEAAYGWTYPYDIEPEIFDAGIGFSMNAAIVAAGGAKLSAPMFGEYLDAIEYVINQHIIRMDDDLEPHERVHQVEDEIYRNGAGSLKLISLAQLAILDAPS